MTPLFALLCVTSLLWTCLSASTCTLFRCKLRTLIEKQPPGLRRLPYDRIQTLCCSCCNQCNRIQRSLMFYLMP